MAAAADSSPVFLDWPWLQESLWTASANGSIGVSLNVIDTVYFTAGIPTRWLHTADNGQLIARRFSDEGSSELTITKSGASNMRVLAARLAEVLQSFIGFITRFNGGEPPTPGSPVLSVLRKDGKTECLSAQDMSTFAGSPQWMAGVATLQPLLPPHEVRSGLYLRKTMRISSVVVQGKDFVGEARTAALKDLLRERAPEVAEESQDPGTGHLLPRTHEDWVTVRMVRLLHSIFTVFPGVGTPPPPYVSNMMVGPGEGDRAPPPPPGTKKEGISIKGSKAAIASAKRRAAIEAAGGEPDAMSSDSDSGHAATVLTPPCRSARMVAIALVFAVDARGAPWLYDASHLVFQSIVPIASSGGYTTASRRNKAAASGGLGGSVGPPITATGYPKPESMGLLEPQAREGSLTESEGAANAAHRELRNLVIDGAARGLSVKAAFAHFEEAESGGGAVSGPVFYSRLCALGIELHGAAWNILQRRIPRSGGGGMGSEGLIALEDFATFVATEPPRGSAAQETDDKRLKDLKAQLEASKKAAAAEDAAIAAKLHALTKQTLAAELAVGAGGSASAGRSSAGGGGEAALLVGQQEGEQQQQQPGGGGDAGEDAYSQGRAAYEALQRKVKSIGAKKPKWRMEEEAAAAAASAAASQPLSSVVPDDAHYDITPSGHAYDFAPRDGPLLGHDARPGIVNVLGGLIETGEAKSFGLIDWRLRDALLVAAGVVGSNKPSALPLGGLGLLKGGEALQHKAPRGMSANPNAPPTGEKNPPYGGAYGGGAKPPQFEAAWKASREKATQEAREHIKRQAARERRQDAARLKAEELAAAYAAMETAHIPGTALNSSSGSGGGGEGGRGRRLKAAALRALPQRQQQQQQQGPQSLMQAAQQHKQQQQDHFGLPAPPAWGGSTEESFSVPPGGGGSGEASSSSSGGGGGGESAVGGGASSPANGGKAEKKSKFAWQEEEKKKKEKDKAKVVVDEVAEARKAAASAARSRPKPRTAFPSPQEWWFDNDTSCLYQVLMGPQMVASPIGALRLEDVRKAGIPICSKRGRSRDGKRSAMGSSGSQAAAGSRSHSPVPPTAAGQSPGSHIAAGDVGFEGGGGGGEGQSHLKDLLCPSRYSSCHPRSRSSNSSLSSSTWKVRSPPVASCSALVPWRGAPHSLP